MDADILPPTDDRIFKVLLTHPNAKQVLIDVEMHSQKQDEHERARALSRKKYEMDMYSSLHTAELRGELKGKIQGEQLERDKWQGVVAEKDAENERLRLEISELRAKIK
jgi:hypothetical protein